MAQNKTSENNLSVVDFLNSVEDEDKKNDSFILAKFIAEASGFEAKMWGTAIVGFGSYHYKYESGREGDAPLAGFSPRKNAISLYVALSETDRALLLPQFGKHKSGKGCIYINKINDINTDVLKQIVQRSVELLKTKYG